VDAQEVMESVRNIGRKALADFFTAMTPQKAHWYSITSASCSDQVFPPLSTLLLIDPEVMNYMLEQCGLCFMRTGISSPQINSWHSFIAEYRLDIEVTTFSIAKKRHYFIRIGSWDKQRHPIKLPSTCWKQKIPPPKLRINFLTRQFARYVGLMNISNVPAQDNDMETDEESSVESPEETEAVLTSETIATEDCRLGSPDLPDPAKFPLLHSLGVCTTTHMNRLIQEIVLFHGSTSITFTRGNNRNGTLIMFPSNRTLDRYCDEFTKAQSSLTEVVKCIVSNTNSTEEEAVSCILTALLSKYEECFVSTCIERGVIEGSNPKKMDVVSTEAMLQEANINSGNARILFRHLRQFFGKSYFESESKRRLFFGDNDYPPTVDKKVLEDKTVIPFWYKRPDLLLQHQLKSMIDAEKLKLLQQLDIVVGGDHGGGKFRMTMKVNFRLSDKTTVSYLTQIGSVSHSKDDIVILKDTVLKPIGEGLRLISEGGCFNVTGTGMEVSFSQQPVQSDLIINCSAQIYLVGDLKFYAQMSGRDGMSSYWCMWCQLHPLQWRNFMDNSSAVPEEEKKIWSLDLMNETLQRIRNGELKEPREKKGIVGEVIWDFIEIRNYIFPQLHFEIGVVNMVLENLYSFVEEQVEVISPEEKIARNNIIVAEGTLEQARERLEEWHATSNPILSRLRLEKSYIISSLRSRTLTTEQKAHIALEKETKEREISELVQQRKLLEKDVPLKRKIVSDRKKELQNIQGGKKKIDLPVSASIENLLNDYNISAAAYHGGKLNGVDCRELIGITKDIFPQLQDKLLAVTHADRCSSEVIIHTCNVHRDICLTLDLISSKIRMKFQEPEDEDYRILERALSNLDYLWKAANMSYTPKIHSILVHVLDQMRKCQGIGDMLEDDVEHVHQMAAKIESRTGRMANKALQPFIHSKIEAIQNCNVIKGQIESSQQSAKRVFKCRDPEKDSTIKNKKLKIERDQTRLKALEEIENKPHANLEPMKFKSK